MRDKAKIENILRVLTDRWLYKGLRLKAVRMLMTEIMNKNADIDWSEVVDTLIKVLVSDDIVSVKVEVAKVLGLLKDQRTVEPLIEVLKNDKNLSVRKAVVMALGEIGDARALKVLTGIVENPKEDASLRKKVEKALEKIGVNQEIQDIAPQM